MTNSKKLLNKNKKRNCFVMLSGGVDSSVAGLLLKSHFNLSGVYFKRYKPDDNKELCMQESKSAQKAAKHLQIPFKVYDLEKEYKEKVFDYLISSYQKGLTPNPDIICNREIKFGAFAQKAFAQGAEFIASGHYAQICAVLSFGSFVLPLPKIFSNLDLPLSLCEAKDKNKDQSYFLSQVRSQILRKTLFPLAKLNKKQTRKIAFKAKLHTANKKDSQGICFIGKKINLKEFLKQYIQLKQGSVLDMHGNKIGTHEGAELYTVGERRGFKILPQHQTPNAQPLFIVRKDVKSNTITVASKDAFLKEQSKIKYITLKSLNFFVNPKENHTYQMRIRHRGEKTKVKIIKITKQNLVLEVLETPYAPARGQFAALYKGSVLIGSGEIQEIQTA